MIDAATSGGFEWRVKGMRVNRCIVDAAFTLQLLSFRDGERDQEEASIRIEGPFEVVLNGVAVHCDPEHDRTSLGPALTLIGHAVKSAVVSESGTLTMTIDGENSLQVAADSDLESWSLSGPGDLLVIGGPNNRVTRFSSTAR